MTHICEVCFTPSDEHPERGQWPAPCCHGCPCGVWPNEDEEIALIDGEV